VTSDPILLPCYSLSIFELLGAQPLSFNDLNLTLIPSNSIELPNK
jgi:hypothetical protein